jgi:hypothetical protein
MKIFYKLWKFKLKKKEKHRMNPFHFVNRKFNGWQRSFNRTNFQRKIEVVRKLIVAKKLIIVTIRDIYMSILVHMDKEIYAAEMNQKWKRKLTILWFLLYLSWYFSILWRNNYFLLSLNLIFFNLYWYKTIKNWIFVEFFIVIWFFSSLLNNDDEFNASFLNRFGS